MIMTLAIQKMQLHTNVSQLSGSFRAAVPVVLTRDFKMDVKKKGVLI